MRLRWDPDVFGNARCFYRNECHTYYFISISTESSVRVYKEHNLSLLAKPYIHQRITNSTDIGIHFFNVVLSGILI